VDRPSESAITDAEWEIPYPVLSDPDLALIKAFHVDFKVPDELIERYMEMGHNLENASGRDHHTIAVPSIFLIDAKGVVRWAHADEDYKTRPSAEQVITAISALNGPTH